MNLEEWIRQITDSGNLCDTYIGKVSASKSNRQLFDVVLSGDGIYYLPKMTEMGFPLDYSVLTSRFMPYLNNRYTGRYASASGDEYTSSLYCLYSGEIVAQTTQICLLGCDISITINEGDLVRIYADRNTSLSISCVGNGQCIVVLYGNAKLKNIQEAKNIKIINR